MTSEKNYSVITLGTSGLKLTETKSIFGNENNKSLIKSKKRSSNQPTRLTVEILSEEWQIFCYLRVAWSWELNDST